MLLTVVGLYFLLSKLLGSAAAVSIDPNNPNFFAERAQMRGVFTGVGVVLFAIAMFLRGSASGNFGKFIARLVLLEGVGILGFVYAMQFAHDPAAYFPFMGLSVLGLLISFPRS